MESFHSFYPQVLCSVVVLGVLHGRSRDRLTALGFSANCNYDLYRQLVALSLVNHWMTPQYDPPSMNVNASTKLGLAISRHAWGAGLEPTKSSCTQSNKEQHGRM